MIYDVNELLAKHPLPPLPNGKPFILHGIQVEDIATCLTLERAGLFLPVGYGKTVIATMVALAWMDHHRIVLLPPILGKQWVKWINSIPGSGGAVNYRGTPKQRAEIDLPSFSWWVMSNDVFKNDFAYLTRTLGKKSYTTVVDECFPAGTRVLTEEGERDIASLRVGEKVLTSNGPQTILSVFEHLGDDLVALELNDGRTVTCTPNHPVFTDRGWITADCCEGRGLVSASALRDVRQGVQEAEELAALGGEVSDADRAHLFEVLRADSADVAGPWEDRSALTRAGSDQLRAHSTQTTTLDGVPAASSSLRVRNLDADSFRTGSSAAPAQAGLRVGRDSPDRLVPEAHGLSDTLPSGLRASHEEDSLRGGRSQPQVCGGTGAGPQEGSQARQLRVVRVSHHKCESPVPVFNLEVEGCPHYFAEGILVHNCQSIKNINSKLFTAVNNFSLGRHLLLLTGTELNNPGDAYAYIKLKTPTIYRNKSHFENVHVLTRDFFNNPLEWVGLDVIKQNLYISSVQRTKEEVHKHLPQPNYQPMAYDLTPKHKAFYDELAEKMILETERGGKIDGSTPQRLRNALQQIVLNWALFSENPDNRPAFLDLLDTVMDQIDVQDLHSSKLIVWTWFKNSTRLINDYLNEIGVPSVAAYSETNSIKSVGQFMDDPHIRALVAQPGSAGAGLNPQHLCWNCVFAEIPSRSIPFRQSAGRIDREGQLYRPNIYIAMANGTVQGGMYQSLLSNDGLVQVVQGNEFDIRKLVYG